MEDSFCCSRLRFSIAAFLLLLFFSITQAQIKINEVMVRPGGNQGLIVFNGNSGNEYVELYNPGCTVANVSGYFIACRQDFAGTTSGGAFRIPNVAAANIAPGGHLVLGTSTSSADPNSIDIKLPDYPANYCLNNSGYNFILANADGWIALFDAAGVPIDAAYWSSAAGNISQAADFGGVPCVPAGSPGGVVLESAQQINSGFPGVLSYVGANPAAGVTFSRIPDGGAWQAGVAPSVNDLTVGNCNGGNCQPVSTITFTATRTQPNCGSSNGSITMNVTSPGTPSFAWSANAATGNNATASNLAAGTYSVTVTQSGCTKDTTITLTSPNGVTLSLTNPVNPTCAGNDGSITVNLAGGSAPYNITIDTGGTPINVSLPFPISQTVGNVPAGTVNVSVTDGGGCTASATATLTAPANCCTFSLAANITQAACGSSNGSIAITTSSGSGNYTYTWSANAATGNSATAGSLSSGVYLLTVTDNGFANCFIDTSFTVSNPNAPVIDSSVVINETCPASGDGSVTVYASGGNGTLSYAWSANANTGNTNFAAGLTAGNYSFTVTDASNCQVAGNANVQSGFCCNLQTTATSVATTCGQANGSISVNIVSGSQPPIAYSINGGASQSSSVFSSLLAGNYVVITTAGQNCADTLQVTVAGSSNNLSVSLQGTDATCFGAADGAVNSTVNGATGNITYQWSNGAATQNISALTNGTYTLTVSDAGGCSASASAQITQPAALNINLGNDTTLCTVSAVQISAPAGFSNYAWSNGLSTSAISVNTAGTYAVTVTDNNGCTATDALSVLLSSALTLDAGEDKTIYEGNSIGLNVSLGGSATGQFLWSPSATLSCADCQNTVASPAISTLYTLTYTDNNNCSVSDSVLVSVLPVGDVFFPNAFSPNGDGNNDVYRALGSGVKSFRLKIFNRWGELIFESGNFNEGWDGIYKGVPQPMGVYVYTCDITLLNNSGRSYKGTITLIR